MFAAYKDKDEPKTSTDDGNFLENPSFTSVPIVSGSMEISSSSDDDSEEEDKNTKVLAIKERSSPPRPVKITIYEDRQRSKEYLKMDSLPSRCVPWYEKSKFSFSSDRQGIGKKKFRRYFNVKRIKKLMTNPVRMLDDSTDKEDDMRVYLLRNSHEIEKWIEYIQYKVS